ncbi:MAG: DUF2149 domain-containing protein [Bacteroidales bacterium]|jgi:hypothetical protein|nr:DUF2149 domain-containing protein [Bacteroidales bacterium]
MPVRRRIRKEDNTDPMGLVSNLFDVAMVFAVALMVALVTKFNMTEVFSKEDYTIVKNPGTDKMVIITKKGEQVTQYSASDRQEEATGQRSKRVGIAYELESGEIVYIPE